MEISLLNAGEIAGESQLILSLEKRVPSIAMPVAGCRIFLFLIAPLSALYQAFLPSGLRVVPPHMSIQAASVDMGIRWESVKNMDLSFNSKIMWG